MKHRTQVLLEPQHYTFLKERAIRERKSLSAILRRILDQAQGRLAERKETDPVIEIIGKFKGPREDGGRRAEDILYGEEG